MPTRRRRAVAALTALVAATLLTVGTTDVTGSTPATAPVTPVGVDLDEPEEPDSFGLDPVIGSQSRPNVVVIMTDDMRADEVRYMPNVRRLIGDAGVTWANSFSPHSLCCPARASFVSGQYTHNHEVWSNREPYGFEALDDRRTVATDLHDVGYNTAFLGKYLNGYGGQPAPDGSAPDSLAYVPPGWDDWRGAVGGPEGWDDPEAGGTYRYWDTTLNVNGVLEGNQGVYQTHLFGRHSEDVIAGFARSPKPFFLWASYVAPHSGMPHELDDPRPVTDSAGTRQVGTPARPHPVRDRFDSTVTTVPGAAGEADVRDKPFFIRALPQITDADRAGLLELARQRAESLAVLDDEVGNTVDALAAAGELDDTIVVFTSDNGFFLGEHRKRQGKNLPYEPSMRVPLLMRGPGIPAGATRRDPILTIDLAPTFLAAAGAQPDRQMDGVSLLDVARNGDEGWSRAVLVETGPRRAPAGTELLSEPGGPSALRFTQGVRTPRYLYAEHASRERELYDLRTDPGELDSIVDRPSAARVAATLARLLDALRDCTGADCAAPLPRRLQQP